MCPLVSITGLWLCVSYILVYNYECAERTVLAQTYTKENATKIVVLGVMGAKDFEYHSWQLVSLLLFCLCSFKA